MFSGEKRAYLRFRIFLDISHSPAGYHTSAVGSGAGPHLDDPSRMIQYLWIMVDQSHGIAVGHKIVHHSCKTFDIGRVKPDRGLVEHIKHAGGAVSHSSGELHALTLTG